MARDVIDDPLPVGTSRMSMAIAIIVAVCVVGYLIDLWLIKYALDKSPTGFFSPTAEVLKGVIENVIGGAVAALLLAVCYRAVIRWIESDDRVTEISSQRITEQLCGNARTTRNYTFIGNTASFVVSSVIPMMRYSSAVQSQHRTLRMFLLDPCDIKSVERYLDFKFAVAIKDATVESSNPEKWPTQMTATPREAVATIQGKILAAIYLGICAAQQHNFRTSIFLRASYSPFRVDISDKAAVLTQESRRESAIAFSSKGHFYSWYQKECDSLEAQSSAQFHHGTASKNNPRLSPPESGISEIRRSVDAFVKSDAHLCRLASDLAILEAASQQIARPSHSYKA